MPKPRIQCHKIYVQKANSAYKSGRELAAAEPKDRKVATRKAPMEKGSACHGRVVTPPCTFGEGIVNVLGAGVGVLLVNCEAGAKTPGGDVVAGAYLLGDGVGKGAPIQHGVVVEATGTTLELRSSVQI